VSNEPNNTHILLLHLHTHTYRELKGDNDDDDQIIDRADGQKQVFGFEPLPHDRNESRGLESRVPTCGYLRAHKKNICVEVPGTWNHLSLVGRFLKATI
jgi:hypothetical protein